MLRLYRTKLLLVISMAAFLIAVIVSSFGLVVIYNNYCQNIAPAKSEFGKSPVLDIKKISEGFTLFSSFNFTGQPFVNGKVYLVDLYGKPVHVWKTTDRPLYSILKPNGNLLVALSKKFDNDFPQPSRIYLQEIDSKSNVIWEYQEGGMHHDFDVLPNGNVAVLVWKKLPVGIAQAIQGGAQGTEFKGSMLSDEIIELNHDKKIVWSWNASEYLNPYEYKIPEIFNREQWTQANSLKYIKIDPIFQKEAYLVSMRTISTLLLISKDTGEIIWKSPKGLFGHQHDATLLENGNILVFNNGFYTSRPVLSTYTFGSEVLEIDPKTNKVVWMFSGGDNPLDRSRLFAPILGGAQRLPSGNTLITMGTTGQLLEVTPEKKVIWDFVNPYSDQTNQPFPSNYIFKARRYYQDDLGWLEKVSDPSPILASYCQ